MKISDVLGCVGWAAFVLIGAALVPFFGPFLSLLTPLPFLYYSTKLGLYQGVKLAALTTLAMLLFAKLSGHSEIVLFCIEFSLLGLFLSVMFQKGLNLGQTILYGTGFMLSLAFGFFLFLALSKGIGPTEMMMTYLQTQLGANIQAYEAMGISGENAMELEAYGRLLLDAISKVYPSLMIVGTGLVVWVNVVLAKPLFRKGNLRYPVSPPVDRWQAPDMLVWGVIVSGFALFLASGSIRLLAVNTLIVLVFVYLFQGLSIVLFFLNKYKVPAWMRIGIYFLIVIQQLFLAIMALAGLFDQWVDFRKIHRKTES
jgi:uncharacterized protein YybS (DUF2232 family)